MEKAVVDNAMLAYEITGFGEPVLFVHGALIAEAFRPLLTEPSLAAGYKLITYHRRGYGESSRASISINMAQQVADCQALLHYLGIERAHVVGYYCGWTTLSDAISAMETGGAYVNVHTQGIPGGEIRGQIDTLVQVGGTTSFLSESSSSSGTIALLAGGVAAVAIIAATSAWYTRRRWLGSRS